MTAGLNELELEAIRLSADLMGVLAKVVGKGSTRDADLQELAAHIHGIQHAVMSQAAARAHPRTFRLLGETIRPEYNAWNSEPAVKWALADGDEAEPAVGS